LRLANNANAADLVQNKGVMSSKLNDLRVCAILGDKGDKAELAALFNIFDKFDPAKNFKVPPLEN